MQLEINFWQFLVIEAGLIAFFVALLVGALKAFSAQFNRRLDDRFAAQDKLSEAMSKRLTTQFDEIGRELRTLERQQSAMREEMLRDYVRREDQIRDQTVTQAKLDALSARIELLTQHVAKLDHK